MEIAEDEEIVLACSSLILVWFRLCCVMADDRKKGKHKHKMLISVKNIFVIDCYIIHFKFSKNDVKMTSDIGPKSK